MKRLKLLSAVFAIGLASTAMATHNGAHFGIGTLYNNYDGEIFNLNIAYVDNQTLADVFGNIGSGDDNGYYSGFGVDLGLRRALDTNGLFVTYGIAGNAYNQTYSTKNSSLIGGFAGIDYQGIPHILLSVKMFPYAYYSAGYDAGYSYHESQFFTNGSVAISYLF